MAACGLRVDYGSVLSQRSIGQNFPDGVVISEVLPGSAASKEKLLQPDRFITRVNGLPVTTPREFYRMVEQAGSRIELTVNNSGREEVVTLDNK